MLLRKTQLYQNQHVMGWGAENPEPSPGVFDWKSLDARVATIRATNGTPVLTLCCAPDWMKGGVPGTTDWSRLAQGLEPQFYDDFADLAREVARRYPDVKHFLVWNELKGFWDSGLGRWGYETYTDLYNRVYAALKSVNPEIQVGGPYVVVDSTLSPQPTTSRSVSGSWGHADQRSLDVIDYWLEHAVGAEFVVIDASTKPRDAEVSPDPFAATEKFSAIAAWVRQRTKLPIWWAEWYVAPSGPDPQRNAVAMQILLRMVETSDVALLWEPEISGSERCTHCFWLWTSTRQADGGQPTPFGEAFLQLAARFPAGTSLELSSIGSGGLDQLRSKEAVAFVNTSASAQVLRLEREEILIEPYEFGVKLLRARND